MVLQTFVPYCIFFSRCVYVSVMNTEESYGRGNNV